MKGKFIAFEGTEGVGKSTQVRMLCEYLDKIGTDYLLTREPGGCKISEDIRDVVLSGKNKEMCFETEVLLYAAARAQHVREVILPALAKGKLVICDRFVLSSLAYQGFGRNLHRLMIEANAVAFNECMPNYNFFLDLPVDKAFERKGGADKSDRLETSGDEFFERVAKGYEEIKKRDDVVVIDTSDCTKFQTHDKIVTKFKELQLI